MDLDSLKRSILSINKELRNTTGINATQKESNIVTNKITSLMDEAVYTLYEDEIIKRCYSRKTLQTEIYKFINNYKEQSQRDFFDNLHTNIIEFINNLKNRPKQSISYFIIISYLNTEIDFDIGNTKIIGSKSSEIKRISDRFDSNLRAPNVKVNNYISSLFTGKVNPSISLALYEIHGIEIEQIKEIALNEIKLVINIIRLFYFFEHRHTLSYRFNYFGISGFSFNKGQFIDYITSEEKSSIQIKNSFSIPFKIDSEFIIKIQTYQNILSNILRSNSKTELDKLLITSIDFFGEGVNDFIYKYSFLSFFISLEVLLLRIKEDNITTKLSNRVAIILGHDSKEKQHISKDIEKLYNIRSAIVHKGEDMVRYQDLLLLGNYTCDLILEMLRFNSLFENQDSLLNQIDAYDIYSDKKFIDAIQNQK